MLICMCIPKNSACCGRMLCFLVACHQMNPPAPGRPPGLPHPPGVSGIRKFVAYLTDREYRSQSRKKHTVYHQFQNEYQIKRPRGWL